MATQAERHIPNGSHEPHGGQNQGLRQTLGSHHTQKEYLRPRQQDSAGSAGLGSILEVRHHKAALSDPLPNLEDQTQLKPRPAVMLHVFLFSPIASIESYPGQSPALPHPLPGLPATPGQHFHLPVQMSPPRGRTPATLCSPRRGHTARCSRPQLSLHLPSPSPTRPAPLCDLPPSPAPKNQSYR